MAGGHGGEGERGQEGEADHHPAGDDGNARPLGAPGPARPGQSEGTRGEDRRDDGPA
ncbi:hypothetical protein NicSoilB8_20700 [Arthrobacter sp. NicSoilB8]|nr:hypothetical protein NicSoilB8_20700 [Arthrobacter sp. NicSoilB8]